MDSWGQWIKENRDRGVSDLDLYRVMSSQGLSKTQIQAILKSHITPDLTISESWKNWIKTNVLSGIAKEEIVKIMTKHGFVLSDIEQELEKLNGLLLSSRIHITPKFFEPSIKIEEITMSDSSSDSSFDSSSDSSSSGIGFMDSDTD